MTDRYADCQHERGCNARAGVEYKGRRNGDTYIAHFWQCPICRRVSQAVIHGTWPDEWQIPTGARSLVRASRW